MTFSSEPQAPMPAYFIGHGSPYLLDEAQYPPDHPVSQGMNRIGQEILAQRPRAMLIVSAHWQSEKSGCSTGVQINSMSPTPQPLIYDFKGFADWLYRVQFAYKPDTSFSTEVTNLLRSADIPVDQVDRGFDHGVWAPLKKSGLDNAPFPIVQLSLFAGESMSAHLQLGKVLGPLRYEGVVIVGSGMAVHNLYDYFSARSSDVLSYVEPFDREVDAAVLQPLGTNRNAELVKLKQSKLLSTAHPTLEHLLPLYVVVGAAFSAAETEKMLENYEISISWSCYKFN
ncbi:hypothetical protein GGI07_001485 [Coemansia sp. Benny D115]|nr:hypothetical protein GGI07_001485 [Coemansia sp. Benny D115]